MVSVRLHPWLSSKQGASAVAYPAQPYFSTLFHKRQHFRKKPISENKMFFLILSTILSKTFLILRRTEPDTIINVHRSSCKVPIVLLYLSDFNQTWIFWQIFGKKFKYLMKIRPVGGGLFHADGQTDMTKLTVAFSKFTNVPRTPAGERCLGI